MGTIGLLKLLQNQIGLVPKKSTPIFLTDFALPGTETSFEYKNKLVIMFWHLTHLALLGFICG